MSMLKNNEQKENEERNYKVYVHTNKINNKKYVGITKQDPKCRWKNGFGYYSKNNTSYLWKAIQKYGWDSFTHEIIEEGLLRSEANEKEKYYIKLYDSSNPSYGYNLTLGGDGFCGMPRSEETKKKISESLKGKYTKEKSYWYGKHIPKEAVEKQIKTKKEKQYHHTEEWKRNHSQKVKGKNNVKSKPVRCINTGKEFVNAREAGEYYHTDNSRIHKCCKGIEKSSGKHPVTGEYLKWEYVDKDNPRTEINIICRKDK